MAAETIELPIEFEYDLEGRHIAEGIFLEAAHVARAHSARIRWHSRMGEFIAGITGFLATLGLIVCLLRFVFGHIFMAPSRGWFVIAGIVGCAVMLRRLFFQSYASKRYASLVRSDLRGRTPGAVGRVRVRFEHSGAWVMDRWLQAHFSWNVLHSPRFDTHVFIVKCQGRGTLVVPMSAIGGAERARALAALIEAQHTSHGGVAPLIRDYLIYHDLECWKCGYNLHSAAELRCPECGEPVELDDC